MSVPAWVAGYADDVLTPSEARLLQLLADGRHRYEAARELHYSDARAKELLASARRRLGARTTPQAVAVAWRAGAVW